jgi:hypothetical protein
VAYEDERPASVKSATAYQHPKGEYVLVTIKGEAPDGCHVVRLEHPNEGARPPAFSALWWADPYRVCTDAVQKYEHSRQFQVGKRSGSVVVNRVEGPLTVEVTDFPKSYLSGPTGPARSRGGKTATRKKAAPKAKAGSRAKASSRAKAAPKARSATRPKRARAKRR